jgi:hypothetical protein
LDNLGSLEQLKKLTQLSLYVSGSQVSDPQLLDQLKRLQLEFSLDISQVSYLESLEQLKGLTQLSLNLYIGEVSNLEPLRNLPSLQKLSIDNATRAQRMSLRNIPPSLVELTF